MLKTQLKIIPWNKNLTIKDPRVKKNLERARKSSKFGFKKGQIAWNKGKKRWWSSPTEFKKGSIPWNKNLHGDPRCLKGIEKAIQANKGNKYRLGKYHTEETKKQISLKKKANPIRYWLGKGLERIGQKNPFYGKKHTKENLKKMSLIHRGKLVGDKNPNWKGGISKFTKTERRLLMETVEYKNWRRKVFERDDYTCQNCGQVGGYLHADHKKPWVLFPQLRFKISNGQTLCEKCHKEKTKLDWQLYNLNQRKEVFSYADTTLFV